MKTGYEYLLEFFPDYNYRQPKEPHRVVFSRPDNITGHQQRAFNVWWAIEQCRKTGGVGLELGSGGIHTPWCLSTDNFATDNHPVYGGGCHPHMQLNGATRLPFEADSFSLILANHVVEHLPGDTHTLLRDWLRTLKSGGVLGVVLPDQTFVDVLAIDKSHVHAWTAAQFREMLHSLEDVAVVEEFDTFKNNFSFDAVMRKR